VDQVFFFQVVTLEPKLKINWDPTFKLRRALDRKIHFSLVLFNIVVDMFAIILNRTKERSDKRDCATSNEWWLLTILQYAHDVVFFMDHDIEQTKNMKLLLCAFKQLFGLQITIHTSEIFSKRMWSAIFTTLLLQHGLIPLSLLGYPNAFMKNNNKY
jgi:hypothetical protein